MATIKSIEEKAKAYDEALERARIWKEKSGMPKDKQGILDDIFPELAESEDEKIRKALIDYFDDANKADENPLQSYGIHTDKVIAWLEKQGEHKSTDRAESKFKVGDWITNGATKPAQISSIEDDMYYTHNGTIGGDIESMDKDYHLWTIQDAKDGDVLATDTERPFIFKGCLDEKHPNSPVAYCGVNYDNCFFISDGISWWTDENIYPATKEQRDTLEKSMADAGYTFDFEKKELRKIEQKSTQETKPFEIEHGKYYYCIEDCFCGGKKQASKGDVIQALRGLPIIGLKDASEYFLPVNFIKEIWSEDDEETLE